jgi:hypothetical protein
MRPEATRRLMESLEGSGQPFNASTIPTVVQQQPQGILQAIFDLFNGGGPMMISNVTTNLFEVDAMQQQKLEQAQTNQGLQGAIKNALSGGPTAMTITNIFTNIFNFIK